MFLCFSSLGSFQKKRCKSFQEDYVSLLAVGATFLSCTNESRSFKTFFLWRDQEKTKKKNAENEFFFWGGGGHPKKWGVWGLRRQLQPTLLWSGKMEGIHTSPTLWALPRFYGVKMT
jgi:hypothetical protein